MTNPTPLRSFADLASASIERMTPSDRRRIFRAIDENWDDDAGRYIGGMGDQGIASQLNVARAWVEHVRKDSFGDSADNEDMEKLREELAELKGKVGVSLDEMQRLQSKAKEFGDQAATVAERLHTYFSRLTDLEKRLGATERAVGVRR
jgi:septal ring factor EnvC (AmiA/AmiB activator)